MSRGWPDRRGRSSGSGRAGRAGTRSPTRCPAAPTKPALCRRVVQLPPQENDLQAREAPISGRLAAVSSKRIPLLVQSPAEKRARRERRRAVLVDLGARTALESFGMASASQRLAITLKRLSFGGDFLAGRRAVGPPHFATVTRCRTNSRRLPVISDCDARHSPVFEFRIRLAGLDAPNRRCDL